MEPITAEQFASLVSQFTGSECFYKHFTGRTLYTQGVQFVAERLGAYWLIDAIASHQSPALDRQADGFQVWELTATDRTAVLTCRADSDQPALVTQRIEYTDFPFPSVKFFVQGDARTVSDHFADVGTMVDLGSGAQRQVDDVVISPPTRP